MLTGLLKSPFRLLRLEDEMTDYNDGKWHGWNGGEGPVHLDTIVEIRNLKAKEVMGGRGWSHGGIQSAGWSDRECWLGFDDDKYNPIIAFRVITPYVEPKKPRDIWVRIEEKDVINIFLHCPEEFPGAILFREVLS